MKTVGELCPAVKTGADSNKCPQALETVGSRCSDFSLLDAGFHPCHEFANSIRLQETKSCGGLGFSGSNPRRMRRLAIKIDPFNRKRVAGLFQKLGWHIDDIQRLVSVGKQDCQPAWVVRVDGLDRCRIVGYVLDDGVVNARNLGGDGRSARRQLKFLKTVHMQVKGDRSRHGRGQTCHRTLTNARFADDVYRERAMCQGRRDLVASTVRRRL